MAGIQGSLGGQRECGGPGWVSGCVRPTVGPPCPGERVWMCGAAVWVCVAEFEVPRPGGESVDVWGGCLGV